MTIYTQYVHKIAARMTGSNQSGIIFLMTNLHQF